MPNQITDKDAINCNNNNKRISTPSAVGNATKSEVLSINKVRKSLIPLLRVSGHSHRHVKESGSNDSRLQLQLPRYSQVQNSYLSTYQSKFSPTPVAPSAASTRLAKIAREIQSNYGSNSGTGTLSGRISSNERVSKQIPTAITGPKGTTPLKRNLKSIHSSIIRLPGLPLGKGQPPTGEGCHLVQQKETRVRKGSKTKDANRNLLEWEDNETVEILRIQLPCVHPEPRREELQLPLCPFVKFSLEMGKTADRTRGYFLCPICNEPFCNPAVIACGHLFCIRCLSGWFEDQDNCPCCRYPIVMKDASDSLLAKEFPELLGILLSVLPTANFYSHLKDQEILPPSSSSPTTPEDSHHQNGAENNYDSDESLHSCEYSSRLLNCVAPIFREIFQKPPSKGTSSQAGRKGVTREDPENVKTRNSFIVALWYIRQWLTLRRNFNPRMTNGNYDDEEVAIIQSFPALTKQETQHGNQFSRESLLTKVMSMKPSHHTGGSVPSLDLTNSRRKLMTSTNSSTQQQHGPSFRFRIPSSVGFTKMFMAGFLLLVIALAVHLFDDHHHDAVAFEDLHFSKMDVVVFLVTVFTAITYTETERVTFWRRQQQGQGPNNRRRRANNPPRYRNRNRGVPNIRRIENLFAL